MPDVSNLRKWAMKCGLFGNLPSIPDFDCKIANTRDISRTAQNSNMVGAWKVGVLSTAPSVVTLTIP